MANPASKDPVVIVHHAGTSTEAMVIRGLLESGWSGGDGGRRRRVYRLTRRGKAELVRQRATWGSYVRAMQAALA